MPASFMETPRFPDNISRGVNFGPEFVTSIATTTAGYEYRNRVRSRALCRGDCSHSVRTEAQHKELLTFFRSVGGRFTGFRFKDWSDYQCVGTQGFLSLVSGNIYQMYKFYEASTGFNESRKITKPVNTTIEIFRNRSAVVTEITSSSTIDYTTGKVTVTNHVAGDTYLWTGEFDVPCRFDTDRMSATMTHHEVFSWDQIPIVELNL